MRLQRRKWAGVMHLFGISRCANAIYIINPPHQRCYEQRMPKNKPNIAFARGTFCLKCCVFSTFLKSRLHFGRLFGQHPCPGRRCPKAILKCQDCHAFPGLLLKSNRIIKLENEFGTNMHELVAVMGHATVLNTAIPRPIHGTSTERVAHLRLHSDRQ